MTDTPSLWDHPTTRKWFKETVTMVSQAQLAENIVAMIDKREPRRAEIELQGEDTIVVIYRDKHPYARPEDPT